MQQDENTPNNGREIEENVPDVQPTVDGRPALYGRKVLSFVRRSARLDARLQRAWDAYADTYLLNINAGEGSLDVREGFVFDQAYIRETWGNTNPLIVEIGSGQGENVVAAAAARPDVNFLALEVYDPGVAHTLLLAGKQNLKNLRIAQINAPELLKAAVDGSIAEVWTFFPDPWPKKKQFKRRLTAPEFLDKYRALLPEGGAVWFKTDNGPLFDWSLESFRSCGWALADMPEGTPMTDYEARFTEMGLPIHRVVATRP